MSLRRHPTELEQREHLAVRFGLIQRRDPGPVAERVTRHDGVRRALAVPYHRLLHHGNVVPAQAVVQRGRLRGSIARQVGVAGLAAPEVAARAELLARVLLDPFALSENPASGWRWTYPLRTAEVHGEFVDLHRRMSLAVLQALVGVPVGELRPLKSVPRRYVPFS